MSQNKRVLLARTYTQDESFELCICPQWRSMHFTLNLKQRIYHDLQRNIGILLASEHTHTTYMGPEGTAKISTE